MKDFMKREQAIEAMARAIVGFRVAGPKTHRVEQVEKCWRSYTGEAEAAYKALMEMKLDHEAGFKAGLNYGHAAAILQLEIQDDFEKVYGKALSGMEIKDE